jgi:predicted site-specific integrase-resolvase
VDPVLSPAEAAELLRVEPRTLETWRYRGQGPTYVKIGGRVWYPKHELEAYIDAQKVTA